MNAPDPATERFEADRARLRAVAYRMLGSVSEADDAVQEAWLRLNRADTGTVENLSGWLTTVVARVCLDMLRSRNSRREQPAGMHLPEPVVSPAAGLDPEHEALLADSVGLALMVVLETLSPPERLAFVLHDSFAVPFEEIGPLVGRTPAAARQLASRARRRVHAEVTAPDVDLAAQREVVEAFLAAAREGDFDRLVAALDPDVVLRADTAIPAGTPTEVRGAEAVAARALSFTRLAGSAQRVLVNGAAGILAAPNGQPFSLLGFTVRDGRIATVDVIADRERLRRLKLPAAEG